MNFKKEQKQHLHSEMDEFEGKKIRRCSCDCGYFRCYEEPCRCGEREADFYSDCALELNKRRTGKYFATNEIGGIMEYIQPGKNCPVKDFDHADVKLDIKTKNRWN